MGFNQPLKQSNFTVVAAVVSSHKVTSQHNAGSEDQTYLIHPEKQASGFSGSGGASSLGNGEKQAVQLSISFCSGRVVSNKEVKQVKQGVSNIPLEVLALASDNKGVFAECISGWMPSFQMSLALAASTDQKLP